MHLSPASGEPSSMAWDSRRTIRKRGGPPGSVYIVEGSLKEVQQFCIGKKWGLDQRVGNEGVRGWDSISRRRRTPPPGVSLTHLHASVHVRGPGDPKHSGRNDCSPGT